MKAVQIDLARQIEPLDKVLQFFDLAARSGYNTVQLYLKDRIATPSYSFADPAETYTENDVRRMVEYAAEKELELIPVVSNLGHTERFLEHIELRGMSELRGEISGCFTPAAHPLANAAVCACGFSFPMVTARKKVPLQCCMRTAEKRIWEAASTRAAQPILTGSSQSPATAR